MCSERRATPVDQSVNSIKHEQESLQYSLFPQLQKDNNKLTVAPGMYR